MAGLKWGDYLALNETTVFALASGGDGTTEKRRQRDHSGGDWSDMAKSQGMPAATRSCQRPGPDPPLEGAGALLTP